MSYSVFLLFLAYITLVSRQDTVDWPEWCVIAYVACLAVDKIREVRLLLHKYLYACLLYAHLNTPTSIDALLNYMHYDRAPRCNVITLLG
jgi:hypothetical protein